MIESKICGRGGKRGTKGGGGVQENYGEKADEMCVCVFCVKVGMIAAIIFTHEKLLFRPFN